MVRLNQLPGDDLVCWRAAMRHLLTDDRFEAWVAARNLLVSKYASVLDKDLTTWVQYTQEKAQVDQAFLEETTCSCIL